MDYNNGNSGCSSVLVNLLIGAVLTLALFAFGSLSIKTGASASIFYPPFCFIPWLVMSAIVWFIRWFLRQLASVPQNWEEEKRKGYRDDSKR